MIISTAPMYGIGASGLRAAADAIKVSSHNIANVDTAGFVKSDTVFTERAIRAGVDASAVKPDVKYVNEEFLIANKQAVADDIILKAMNSLEYNARNAGVGNAWNSFVSEVYDFRQKGDPGSNKEFVDMTGAMVSETYNKWVDSISQTKNEYQKAIDNARQRLVQVQVQLATATDDVVKKTLADELSTIEGEIKGNGEIITKVIPTVEAKVDAAMTEVVKKVNTELGSQTFSLEGSKLNYDPSKVTGQQLTQSSITGDTLPKMIGDILHQLGIAINRKEVDTTSSLNARDRANENYQRLAGVDIVEETVKIQRAKAMYEACAKCIQVENENFKTLLAIV